MEQQYSEPRREDPRRPVQKKKRKKDNFKRRYLIYLGVLVVLAALFLVYVRGALLDYEASQPENILQAQVDRLREADKRGAFEEIMPLDGIRKDLNATDEQVAQFKKEFLAGKITGQTARGNTDPSRKVLDVLCDGCKVATFSLKHLGQSSSLVIFTKDQWEVEGFQVTGYEVTFTAPASAIIKNHGNPVEGTATDTAGKFSYSVRGLEKPEITICDVMGNSVDYDQKNLPTFTDFKISVPSNFTVKGKETVPLAAAELTPIAKFANVKKYCAEVPDQATYIVSLLTDAPDLQILDNYGDPVAFQMENRTVTITEQVGKDTLSLQPDIDPMETAKMWSNFMTRDLGGGSNGYATLSPRLVDGSELQKRAKEYAGGVDITFISNHTLPNPPFHTEKIGNYVVYSDNCFSCDVLLEKTMHLTRTGNNVEDKVHSTFYFVKQDGGWKLADKFDIA